MKNIKEWQMAEKIMMFYKCMYVLCKHYLKMLVLSMINFLAMNSSAVGSFCKNLDTRFYTSFCL